MRKLAFTCTALALLLALGGCAYPDGYYRGYYSGYYAPGHSYIPHPYGRTYASTIYAPHFQPFYPWVNDHRIYRPPIYRDHLRKHPALHRHDGFKRHGKARHHMGRYGHIKRHPGHHLERHDGKQHHGKEKRIDRRNDHRRIIGPTIPVRVEHGVSLEHRRHPRENFKQKPHHERRRSNHAGFAAQPGERTAEVKFRGSNLHRDQRSDRQLQSKLKDHRSDRDQAGFKAKPRSPSSGVQFRAQEDRGRSRVRPADGERRGWGGRAFDRGGGSKFCATRHC